MKIINLIENSKVYTSNVFMILGAWNAVDDVNTLVDVGSDDLIINKIESINTGLGKRKIDQVILTHNHSDHVALLPAIKAAYNPLICAYDSHLPGVERILREGDTIKMGEKHFTVLHVPLHSSDSICLFCQAEGVIFVGDTPIPSDLQLQNSPNDYPVAFLKNWDLVKTIYFGHDNLKHKLKL